MKAKLNRKLRSSRPPFQLQGGSVSSTFWLCLSPHAWGLLAPSPGSFSPNPFLVSFPHVSYFAWGLPFCISMAASVPVSLIALVGSCTPNSPSSLFNERVWLVSVPILVYIPYHFHKRPCQLPKMLFTLTLCQDGARLHVGSQGGAIPYLSCREGLKERQPLTGSYFEPMCNASSPADTCAPPGPRHQFCTGMKDIPNSVRLSRSGRHLIHLIPVLLEHPA